MVKVTGKYEGQLHCTMTHEPSHATLATDAPKDNQGKGEAFSPTDLVGTALGSCILTTMAIVAERDQINIQGAEVTVQKEMLDSPRRVGKLVVDIRLPNSVPVAYRPKLEAIAHKCPVQKSIHPDILVPVTFTYF